VNASRWLPVPILLLLVGGCGSSGGSGDDGGAFTFTFLSVNSWSPALPQSSISDVDDTTQVCVTFSNNLKNPTLTSPNSLDNITIQSYTVQLRRADGSTFSTRTYGAGVVVPAGAAPQGSSVVVGNTATLTAILVPPDVKRDPALRTARFPFTGSAEVVFKGRDGRGSGASVEVTIPVVFVATGEDSTATCATTGG
jgi:hypothetical protein